jgi:archaellum component FlaC
MNSDKLESRIISIEHEIHKLHVKLDQVIVLLSQTKTSCDKMDRHIDFIDNTYNSLKAPLEYISDSFNTTKKLLSE